MASALRHYLPEYKRRVQKSNYAFSQYRSHGNAFAALPADWQNAIKVPASRPQPLFDGLPRQARGWDVGAPPNPDFEGTAIFRNDDGSLTEEGRAQFRYNIAKDWFATTWPTWELKKLLGLGGQGMAVHYHKKNSDDDETLRDIVIKLANNGWQCSGLEKEERNTFMQRMAAHSIQIIEPRTIGLPDRPRRPPRVRDFDSSEDEETEGRRRVTRSRAQRRRRGERSARYWQEREKAHDKRLAEQHARDNARVDGGRKDYIILEYLANGSLSDLIEKLSIESKGMPGPNVVPNRILWAFWLCLIRACVGLDYPPANFHPKGPGHTADAAKVTGLLKELGSLGHMDVAKHLSRAKKERDLFEALKALAGDLNEEIPDTVEEQQRKRNLVHFDLDPSNVLISDFELTAGDLAQWNAIFNKRKDTKQMRKRFSSTDPRPDRVEHEHKLVPRLKIADFGSSYQIKSYKRNAYYFSSRDQGKQYFWAPEQFGGEWDSIPADPNGAELGEHEIAGQYSCKTNIWQIAWVIWCLITQKEPPAPPQPQIPAAMAHLNYPPDPANRRNINEILEQNDYNGPISYCTRFFDDNSALYSHVDADLTNILYRCMYHKPADRPGLDELLRQAKNKVLTYRAETDQTVTDWITDQLFSAPVASPPIAGPSGTGGDAPAGGSAAGPAARGPAVVHSAAEIVIFQAQLSLDFPSGRTVIPNLAQGHASIFRAMFDSLRSQRSEIATDATLANPKVLEDMYLERRNGGHLNDHGPLPVGNDYIESNNWVPDAGRVLAHWGNLVGQNLRLMCLLGTGANETIVATNAPAAGPPGRIWIRTSNSMSRDLFPTNTNHYEGLRAPEIAMETVLPDAGLQDYESSDEEDEGNIQEG